MTFNLPHIMLPDEIKEGDVINILINIDYQGTSDRAKKINSLK
ncbi:DUF3006 family protein [Desulfosporosinus orientis]